MTKEINVSSGDLQQIARLGMRFGTAYQRGLTAMNVGGLVEFAQHREAIEHFQKALKEAHELQQRLEAFGATQAAYWKGTAEKVEDYIEECNQHIRAKAFKKAWDVAQCEGGAHPCKHGHIGCASREGGACLDEEFSTNPAMKEYFTSAD